MLQFTNRERHQKASLISCFRRHTFYTISRTRTSIKLTANDGMKKKEIINFCNLARSKLAQKPKHCSRFFSAYLSFEICKKQQLDERVYDTLRSHLSSEIIKYQTVDDNALCVYGIYNYEAKLKRKWLTSYYENEHWLDDICFRSVKAIFIFELWASPCVCYGKLKNRNKTKQHHNNNSVSPISMRLQSFSHVVLCGQSVKRVFIFFPS